MLAFPGRHAVVVEVSGDSGERCGPTGVGRLHMLLHRLGVEDGFGVMLGGDAGTVDAEFDAAGFGGRP